VNLAHLRQYVRSGFRISDSESHEVSTDGTTRIFLNNITGIIEHGCLMRYWGTQRDVTEQRRAEQERRRAEARLRTALAAANLGTWEWDLETDTVSWSETTERIFGVEPGTFDGTMSTYLSLVHPEDRPKAEARLRRTAREGGSLTGDLRILRHDGAVRRIFSRGDVIRNEDGRIVRVVGAAMDITEQHQAAEEKARIDRRLQETQKLESLGILAGGIAHDFNNLLTGILGNASLARMDLPPDSPVQACLEAIETTSQRAAELCKQMLAYSGKGRFVVQRLDLSALVEDTTHLVQLSIGKNAALKFNLAADLPAISADTTQMRQIIMNLVINASDALGDAGGVINLTTGLMHADHAYLTETYLSPSLPDGEYVFLEVSDNGCGMSAETMKKIFDPFFTTKFTGRGLGLAAVLGIVRGHHGALKVYSEPGKGTTFKLLLPRAEGSPEDLSKTKSNGTSWRGSGTVLVVDDEEPVRIVAGRILQAIGFDVLPAAHGREAVEKFREDPAKIAAVLLDLTMPQMDGSATFTELRRIRPEVKVLLMSGFNEQDAIHRFAGKGLAGFLQKPFKPGELHEKLRGMLEPAATPR
jgi:PAS domain S-box-containing protein